MILFPFLPPRYDAPVLQAALDEISRADDDNYKRRRDVEVVAPARLVLQSPNGTLWKIVVSDAGVVSATAI